jgi:hypothetical protein
MKHNTIFCAKIAEEEEHWEGFFDQDHLQTEWKFTALVHNANEEVNTIE